MQLYASFTTTSSQIGRSPFLPSSGRSSTYQPPSPSSSHNDDSSTVLFLAKQKKTNKKAVGGFGSVTAPAAPKTRAVSGHTRGSGTKPLREAANTFDALYKDRGNGVIVHDVYVRSPDNNPTLFWFVGKVAARQDEEKEGTVTPTVQETILCQKRIILEYASRELRPQNLGGPYMKSLEIWTAPGDSEMDCVQNRVSLDKVVGSAAKDIRDGFCIKDVGYNPEIYVGDEIKEGGLRINRDEEGCPVKPEFEVNQGG